MTDTSDVVDLVSTDWLADHLGDPGLRILDGSWWMPGTGHDPEAEWRDARIPGARFFDIDRIADTSLPLPHMPPGERDFADALTALGIGADDHVVVYDAAGLFSAPRVWWTFRALGFARVSVLDGGLPKWRREGHPIESGPIAAAATPARAFQPRLDRRWLRTLDEMRANLDQPAETVLDARSVGRFAGTEPEPRPGLRGGHIPGSKSLPVTTLIDPGTGTLRAASELAATFAKLDVDAQTSVVATCGSGLTAAIIAFALHTLGHGPVAVYDGSWSEWGARADVPIRTGEDQRAD
jgi:thiosulfate/3-mercaptopyruvate sulfurtransferase